MIPLLGQGFDVSAYFPVSLPCFFRKYHSFDIDLRAFLTAVAESNEKPGFFSQSALTEVYFSCHNPQSINLSRKSRVRSIEPVLSQKKERVECTRSVAKIRFGYFQDILVHKLHATSNSAGQNLFHLVMAYDKHNHCVWIYQSTYPSPKPWNESDSNSTVPDGGVVDQTSSFKC